MKKMNVILSALILAGSVASAQVEQEEPAILVTNRVRSVEVISVDSIVNEETGYAEAEVSIRSGNSCEAPTAKSLVLLETLSSNKQQMIYTLGKLASPNMACAMVYKPVITKAKVKYLVPNSKLNGFQIR